jgi:hypothetical protein
MLHWRGLTEVTWESFTPLLMLNRDAAALLVRADSPWRTVGEVEAAIRARSGGLLCSGTARGATWHIAVAGWLLARGIDPGAVRWVPTRGAGPSLQELIAGGLDMVCCSLPEARSLLEAGRVRALGVMEDRRVPGFEDVPTFREQGIDWSLVGWRALGVPRATPEPVVARLRAALRRAATSAEFQDFMKSQGFAVAIAEGAELEATLRAMDAQMGALLTSESFSRIFDDDLGPMLYPSAVGGILVAVLAALALRARRSRSAPDVQGPARLGARAVLRAAAVLGAVALFIVAVPSTGFVAGAGALVFGLLVALGNRVATSAVVAAVIAPLTYQVFAHWLRADLPRGLLDW